MSKHTTPFRPKNVQYANFEMFGATQNKRLPAITSAQKIQDSSIRDLFRQLSKKTSARIDAFKQLKLKIPQIQLKDDFLTVAEPCYSVFETSVSDYTPETRILSIEMISIILDTVVTKYKDQLSKVAKDVFPTLLLLFFDTEKAVQEKAKDLLFEHFPTKEKRNMMISKLRDEISARLRILFNELEGAKWDQLDESQYNENWGRLASMGLTLSSNLLITCRLSNDVFSSINPPPILNWIQTKNNHFPQRTSAAMRAAAYVYISVIVQAGFLELHESKEVSSYIRAESSPLAQEKLLRLIVALLEKQKIKPNDIQQPIIDSLYLYYQPQKAGLEKILERIKDKEFIEKCLTKASQSTDINTANELFNCIFIAGGELLPNEFLLDLLQKSVITNTSPDTNFSNNFFNQCSLQYFKKIEDDPNVMEILSKADEMRAAEFLSYCDISKVENWLKTKQSIKPETLVMIIRKVGTEPIRSAWANIKDIPLEKAKTINSLVDFIKLFINPEEVEYVITNMPECLPKLLRTWEKDLTPFKTKGLLDKAGELLDKDLMLIPIFKKIFPDEPSLTQLIDQTTRNHLKNENSDFNPTIFDYFTPSNELLDDIIFSNAISLLKPKDTAIIPLLTNRIIELIPTSDPVELAEIASEFVKVTEIDPISISASPLNHPIFCFNYWDIVGFDMMNQLDFCNMLECYLHKICPFLPVYLYTQNNEWQNDSSIFPDELYDFIENHKELAKVAFEMKLVLTLATICFINNLDFSSFEAVDSLILLALPNLKPPPKEEETQEKDDSNNKKLVVIEDDLLKTIRCEWNMDVPDFPKENDLRGAVCYLQHYLPVVENFDLFKQMATTYIGSNDTLEFFFSLRLLSMIYYSNQPFDAKDIAFKILEQVDHFSPLPSFMVYEVCNAFQIAKFITPDQFNPFILNTIDFLGNSKTSETVSKIIIPIISFFNAWDLVEGRFNGRMNLSNIEYWHFVTSSLKEMPYKRRIDTIPVFTDSLPSLLSSLDIESKEFMMLITTFPSTAMKWSTKLPNSKAQPLYKYMEKEGTLEVFKQMADTASKMKLDSTTITTDYQNKSIKAVYLEDASSIPIVLTISFPKVYPFRRINVSCEFGDEGENCAYKVFAAIDGHQSIEAGVIAWHQFVTYRLREVEPCTICYSYLSEDMKKPTIACPTCGQKFHGKCLQKWFSQCLKPTCPYCASPWDEKKRDKSKK
ncbi:listerin E3 ubiquitin protein ligase 1 [Tritrichomonas musculus]|uniref:E3 ubiquitin-protein ligase listerin n=1 Tax=Tritrichomonas musculus TaxID=1915356 RepID=A0ABR2JZ77_9EUKA